MGIEVERVGHVVLKVANLERALGFYSGVLGLTQVAQADFGNGEMVFLSAGSTHHDIGLVQVAPNARRPQGGDIGLYHVALKIGDDLETLRAAKGELEQAGCRVQFVADHRVSQSIYVADPDGNNVELYVDAPESVWRNDPAAVATVIPLSL